jgi:hypothetical protein
MPDQFSHEEHRLIDAELIKALRVLPADALQSGGQRSLFRLFVGRLDSAHGSSLLLDLFGRSVARTEYYRAFLDSRWRGEERKYAEQDAACKRHEERLKIHHERVIEQRARSLRRKSFCEKLGQLTEEARFVTLASEEELEFPLAALPEALVPRISDAEAVNLDEHERLRLLSRLKKMEGRWGELRSAIHGAGSGS